MSFSLRLDAILARCDAFDESKYERIPKGQPGAGRWRKKGGESGGEAPSEARAAPKSAAEGKAAPKKTRKAAPSASRTPKTSEKGGGTPASTPAQDRPWTSGWSPRSERKKRLEREYAKDKRRWGDKVFNEFAEDKLDYNELVKKPEQKYEDKFAQAVLYRRAEEMQLTGKEPTIPRWTRVSEGVDDPRGRKIISGILNMWSDHGPLTDEEADYIRENPDDKQALGMVAVARRALAGGRDVSRGIMDKVYGTSGPAHDEAHETRTQIISDWVKDQAEKAVATGHSSIREELSEPEREIQLKRIAQDFAALDKARKAREITAEQYEEQMEPLRTQASLLQSNQLEAQVRVEARRAVRQQAEARRAEGKTNLQQRVAIEDELYRLYDKQKYRHQDPTPVEIARKEELEKQLQQVLTEDEWREFEDRDVISFVREQDPKLAASIRDGKNAHVEDVKFHVAAGKYDRLKKKLEQATKSEGFTGQGEMARNKAIRDERNAREWVEQARERMLNADPVAGMGKLAKEDGTPELFGRVMGEWLKSGKTTAAFAQGLSQGLGKIYAAVPAAGRREMSRIFRAGLDPDKASQARDAIARELSSAHKDGASPDAYAPLIAKLGRENAEWFTPEQKSAPRGQRKTAIEKAAEGITEKDRVPESAQSYRSAPPTAAKPKPTMEQKLAKAANSARRGMGLPPMAKDAPAKPEQAAHEATATPQAPTEQRAAPPAPAPSPAAAAKPAERPDPASAWRPSTPRQRQQAGDRGVRQAVEAVNSHKAAQYKEAVRASAERARQRLPLMEELLASGQVAAKDGSKRPATNEELKLAKQLITDYRGAIRRHDPKDPLGKVPSKPEPKPAEVKQLPDLTNIEPQNLNAMAVRLSHLQERLRKQGRGPGSPDWEQVGQQIKAVQEAEYKARFGTSRTDSMRRRLDAIIGLCDSRRAA